MDQVSRANHSGPRRSLNHNKQSEHNFFLKWVQGVLDILRTPEYQQGPAECETHMVDRTSCEVELTSKASTSQEVKWLKRMAAASDTPHPIRQQQLDLETSLVKAIESSNVSAEVVVSRHHHLVAQFGKVHRDCTLNMLLGTQRWNRKSAY